jgi:hypothetical protein
MNKIYFYANIKKYVINIGRAIAEAVSCWLPTTVAWVRARVWQSGQSGVGAGFLEVLRFHLPKPSIPPTSPSSSQSPGAVSRVLVMS